MDERQSYKAFNLGMRVRVPLTLPIILFSSFLFSLLFCGDAAVIIYCGVSAPGRKRLQKKDKNFFKKPIDKTKKAWYNVVTKRKGDKKNG